MGGVADVQDSLHSCAEINVLFRTCTDHDGSGVATDPSCSRLPFCDLERSVGFPDCQCLIRTGLEDEWPSTSARVTCGPSARTTRTSPILFDSGSRPKYRGGWDAYGIKALFDGENYSSVS